MMEESSVRRREARQVISEEYLEAWFKCHDSKENRYLYILGLGFDQRMCEGIRRIKDMGLTFDVWLIRYSEGEGSPSKAYIEKVEQNLARLQDITQGMNVQVKPIIFWVDNEDAYVQEHKQSRFVGEINATKLIKNAKEELATYTDVILDVSALPQSVYLCIMNALFRNSTNNQRFDIIVNENYSTDMQIEPTQPEEMAHELQGFLHTTEETTDILIWYPVLGERNIPYLRRYHEYLKSTSHDIDEICPVVPFPAVDIRRADNIISGYSENLFDNWNIDKKNILYVSETNPLLVCQNLYEASRNYTHALEPLGKCKLVFSAITSKVMTIGMFMAAYDLTEDEYNVIILNISNKGYIIKDEPSVCTPNRLICLAV